MFQLAYLLARVHGFVFAGTILTSTYYVAAHHVLRYTHSHTLAMRSNAIIFTALVAGLGALIVKFLDNPEFQINTLTQVQGSITALAVLVGWTAALAWDKPRIHIAAWTTAATMATIVAQLTETGTAHNAIRYISIITALAHLTATVIPPVQAYPLRSYSTAEIGILRGVSTAWISMSINTIF